jgi:hypothetical protein
MFQWSIWGGFMQKTRGQKSRATVPLRKPEIKTNICWYKYLHLICHTTDGQKNKNKNYLSLNKKFQFSYICIKSRETVILK